MNRFLPLVGVGLIVMTTAAAASASPVICNTGQTLGCAATLPLVYGTVDPNYVVSGAAQAQYNGNAWVVVGNPGNPYYPLPPSGPWVADDADSLWIAPPNTNSEAHAPIDAYTYSTTLDLTGFTPTAAALYTLTGNWATDDNGVILLNGVASTNPAPGYTSETPFTLTGFNPGFNTISFVVTNSGGGPTGLRVDDVAGIAAVPEPATLLLLGTGLVGALRARTRRGK